MEISSLNESFSLHSSFLIIIYSISLGNILFPSIAFCFKLVRCHRNFSLIQLPSSSSSSCRSISADLPDPFPPPLSSVNRFRLVFKATSPSAQSCCIIGSSWSYCLCSSMWWGSQEYVTYEFVPTSPAVSRMSGSSNLDSFRDGWWVAVCCLQDLFNIARSILV